MAATIKDVASRAGVSIRTVSRAVNGLGDVSEATRQKVLAVAKELGYRPNSLARALVTQRSNTIGLALPHLRNPYFAELAQGVFDQASESGFSVLLRNTHWQRIPEAETLHMLADHAVEGMITACSSDQGDVIRSFARTFQPIIVLLEEISSPGVSAILVDFERGARMAVGYFARQGHQNIAMIAPPHPTLEKNDRVSGYRQVLAEYNLPEIIQTYDSALGEPDIRAGCQAALRLFDKHPEVTAIFTYNDLLAIGAIKACKELGRAVPGDVKILGFDDIPFSASVYPPLTTIRVDQYGMGRLAVKRLMEMMKNPEETYPPVYVDIELVVRESA